MSRRFSLKDLSPEQQAEAVKQGLRPSATPTPPKTAPKAPKPRKAQGNRVHDASQPSPDRPLSDALLEQDQAPALGGPAQGETAGLRRVAVRFTGFRVKPLDPDNFAGSVKDLIDGLRHAGLLLGDEPWRITLETEQVRVKHFAQERTEIVLVYPP
jgi:hypothetical protein